MDLRSISLLSDLSDAEIENLSMFCQEKHLKEGETIFYENDNATAMYILVDGVIEVSRISLDGKKSILGEVHAEEILGEMALFGEAGKRMATAKAKTDCILVTILGFSIKELTSKYPGLLEKIKMIINDRMLLNKNKN